MDISDTIKLLKWRYTVEKPYQKKSKLNLPELYNDIQNYSSLRNELFFKCNGEYVSYKKLKVSKDFNIKDQDLIKRLRTYHHNKKRETGKR